MAGAIFNASISSLLEYLLRLSGWSLFLKASADYNLWSVIGKLTLQVIVPVGLGILLHRWLSICGAEPYAAALLRSVHHSAHCIHFLR